MRKRIWLAGSLFILAVLLTIGFYPLASDSWKIPVDHNLVYGKEQYLLAETAPDTAPLPNIVIILADDLAWGEVSINGGTMVETPHIDAIGQNGVRFSQGYVTASVCSPSRASLLTGRYQQRYGYELQPKNRYPHYLLEKLGFKFFVDTDNWHLAPGTSFPSAKRMREEGLPDSEITLAELLQKKGYATAIMGKWHLGFEPPFLPNKRGFDYHYGFYEAFTLYAPLGTPGIVNAHSGEFSDAHIWSQERKGSCAIRENDRIVEDDAYLTARIAERANHFLETHTNGPFFLYVPFSAPHTPFQAPENYVAMFSGEPDSNKRVYYAMIKALDDAVGRITQRLEDLGLSENTLVFFASDNGGALYTKAPDNMPFTGGKLSNFEGGIRVPYLFQWKGHVVAGAEYTAPVSLMDIFMTAAQACRVRLPADRPYDGINLLTLLETPQEERPLFWRQTYAKAVRSGKWKLVLDERADKVRLFDLQADPSESDDLSAQHPDVVEKLKLELQNWEKQMKDPFWPAIMDHQFDIHGEKWYFPV